MINDNLELIGLITGRYWPLIWNLLAHFADFNGLRLGAYWPDKWMLLVFDLDSAG